MDEEKDALSEAPEYTHLFQIVLLFPEEGDRPTAQAMQEAVRPVLGDTDIVADMDGQLTTLAVRKHPVEYKDGQKAPAQVLMADFAPFEPDKLTDLQRSQLWDCPESQMLLPRCRYQLMLSDFMAAGLPYRERCGLLTGWLESLLPLFPDCIAVWIPSAWKLMTPQRLMENPYEGPARFLHYGVNARFFRIEGTEDMVIDTLGMYAVGLPDVQYHFHGLDPNDMVNHAYNVARYVFDNDAPIESGETIDGLKDGRIDQGVQWECRYEMALIEPRRGLMDVCPGGWSAGQRN